MSDDVHLEFSRVVKKTEKAILFDLEDSVEVWIPISQIRDDADDYEEGDGAGSVMVSRWWADKEGLG